MQSIAINSNPSSRSLLDEAVPDGVLADDPTENLVRRIEVLRELIRNLQLIFERVAETNAVTAKQHKLVSRAVELPENVASNSMPTTFREIFHDIRTQAEGLAAAHENANKRLSATAVKDLTLIRSDLKEHIGDLKKTMRKTRDDIENGRAVTKAKIEHLSKTIAALPDDKRISGPKYDPVIANRLLQYAIAEQTNLENNHKTAILTIQNNLQQLETLHLHKIQDMIESLKEVYERVGKQYISCPHTILVKVGNINPKTEWQRLLAKDPSLKNAELPLRNPAELYYPHKDDGILLPRIEGFLQRKSTIRRKYIPAYYVVTQALYLHEFKSPDPMIEAKPSLSLYLPECTLESRASLKKNHSRFILWGKDEASTSLTRKEYQFLCPSDAEFERWFKSLAEVMEGRVVVEQVPLPILTTSEGELVATVDSGTFGNTLTIEQIHRQPIPFTKIINASDLTDRLALDQRYVHAT